MVVVGGGGDDGQMELLSRGVDGLDSFFVCGTVCEATVSDEKGIKNSDFQVVRSSAEKKVNVTR